MTAPATKVTGAIWDGTCADRTGIETTVADHRTDTIYGYVGNDTINGGVGDAVISGGDGADTLSAKGHSILYSDDGNDDIFRIAGSGDTLTALVTRMEAMALIL